MNALNGHNAASISVGQPDTSSQVRMKVEENVADDIRIWTAFKEGDEQAYEYMFKQHYSMLLNYGLKFSSDQDEVKDHIQQLFTRLWESRERLGTNNSIKSYLLASVRRMIIKGSKRKLNLLSLGNVTPSFQLKLCVENKFLNNQKQIEQAEYLSTLMEVLPKRQKEAIYLKFFGENSFDEIADIMGISKRVVYKLIYKALNNLSNRITDNQRVYDLLS